MLVPFSGQTFDDTDYGVPSTTLTNWYVRQIGDRSDRSGRLMPTPNAAPFAQGTGRNAGMTFIERDGLLAAHIGGSVVLYERDGTINSSFIVDAATEAPTRFESSQLETVMGTGKKVFTVATSGVTEVTLPSGEDVADFAEIGQRHVYIESGSGRLWFSDVADAATIKADAFLTAEDAPDDLLAVRAFQNSLYLYGSKTIQVLRPSGSESSPFYPSPGGTLPKGVIGRAGVTSADFGQFFVGDDNIVYRLAGYQATRISTHFLEQKIEDLAFEDRNRVHLTNYAWEGHTFVVLRIPDVGTWAYDAATNRWHRLRGYQSELSLRTSYQDAWGGVYVGTESGAIGKLSRTEQTEFGDPVIREGSAIVPIKSGYQDIETIIVETALGIGTATGPDVNPQIEVRTSPDGRNWNPWHSGSVGLQGNYAIQTVFGPFGIFRSTFMAVAIRYSGGLPMTVSAVRMNEN